MANIYTKKTPKGTKYWKVQWTLKDRTGNVIKQPSKNFDNAKDAKAFKTKVETEVEGGYGDPEDLTVAGFCNRWLDDIEQDGETRSADTLRSYRNNINRLMPQIGTILLTRLTSYDLEMAYLTLRNNGHRGSKPGKGKPLATSTMASMHRVIFTAMEAARRQKLFRDNPAEDAKAPSLSKRKKARALTKDETKRLLEQADRYQAKGMVYPHIGLVVRVLLATGLRRSELLGLSWSDINLDTGVVEITRTVAVDRGGNTVLRTRAKTESSLRTISVPPSIAARLRQHKIRQAEYALQWGKEYQRKPMLVFPQMDGTPMPPIEMTHKLRRLMRKVGIMDAQPCHAWRHSHGSLLVNSGATIISVAQRLGHASPRLTLETYSHPDEGDDAKATAMVSQHFAGLE